MASQRSHCITVSLIFVIISLIYYFPILNNPDLILNRSNDLSEFFWPIIFFIKNQILQNHTIPFWNNLIFAGTPLLPDPQSQIFYLPNLIFLLLDINLGFLASIYLHSLMGCFAAFFCAKSGFKLSTLASIFFALAFLLAPRFASSLEAGHFGLITAYPWILLALLSAIKIIRHENSKIFTIILSVSLSSIFFSHIVTFLIATLFISMFIFTNVIFFERKNRLQILGQLFLSLLLTFGLTAISLLPQIEWASQTTRTVLLTTRETFPNWRSFKEILLNLFLPIAYSREEITKIDTEKWIFLGNSLIFLAVFGLLFLKRKIQLFIVLLGFIILLLILNNKSPIYGLLINQDWFVLIRVATRFWIIVLIIVLTLATFAIDRIRKTQPLLAFILMVVSLLELLTFSWLKVINPSTNSSNYVSSNIYEFLKEDKDKFRVFCTTRCLSQKQSAVYNLELLDGYNTLAQINYVHQMWQLTNSYWNYYSLSIPPYGSLIFEKHEPDPKALGEFNVKYVISPFKLESTDFTQVAKFDKFTVYRNRLYLPRAYTSSGQNFEEAKITNFSPNEIIVDTSKQVGNKLMLSEVYSKGWTAYLNGKTKSEIQERPNALRLINIKQNTDFVVIRYQPAGFNLGSIITGLTIGFISFYMLFKNFLKIILKIRIVKLLRLN